MKKYFLVILILATSTRTGFCQQQYTSEKDVFAAKELTFYGYDFSHFKLNESKRMSQDMTHEVYSWISFCEQHITSEKLAAWFKKDKVTSNLTPTNERAKKLKNEDIVSFTKNVVSKDSLQSFVDQYTLTEKEGIGMVAILECFDKPTKTTSGYFTFFDIASKRILFSDYFSGKEADGYGLTSFWGVSLIGTTKNYAAEFRKKMKGIK